MASVGEAARGDGDGLTAAQRARSERQRQRARALRDARLVRREYAGAPPDTGGGFLPAEERPPRPAAAPPAPLADPAERPACLECARSLAHSYLLDSFGHPVCDECRDDADAHSLLTRTEARSLFLLKDCDLDARSPPLRCVRRRNPHGARLGDMRLYLRAQVEARALLVWGGEEELERERERRVEARGRARAAAEARRWRALRLAARASTVAGARREDGHVHEYGEERHEPAGDTYERACACGHVLSYEKM